MIRSHAVKLGLEARLEELTVKARQIDAELSETRDPDDEERATELEDDEVLEERGHAAVAEISQIRRALERIDTGTYGICTRCGEQIGEARLVAVPHTPVCIDCAGEAAPTRG